LALLYLFLLSIALMGAAFKMLGSGFSEALISSTSSPVVGLMVGMLATAVIQSSSTTTSIVVGLVAAGALTVRGAVPIVMGANIGTTVTNTIVALTAVNRREEFKRSFAGATMHDFFNVMVVLLLFPLEQATRFLERSAGALADLLVGQDAVEFANPVKDITKPVAAAVIRAIETTGWTDPAVGSVALALALLGLFLALYRLPKLLKALFLSRAEGPFFRRLERGGLVGILIGVFLTVLVQSSSITTSLLVPMIGAGLVPLEGAFAITLGANIGTTVTAMLASTAGTHDSVTIALVHLIFNLTGIAIIYPFRPLRRIPIRLAERLAELSMRSRAVPVLYLVFLFFLLPGLIILVQRLVRGS
jgi:sodium-dependent phosphate cotransporter